MDGLPYVSPNEYKRVAAVMEAHSRSHKERFMLRVCLRVTAQWLRLRAEG